MAGSYDDQELLGMLSELEQLDTTEWASGALFELALDQLLASQEADTAVGRALGQLMRAELHYHRRVEQAVEGDDLALDELSHLHQQQREALEHNVGSLQRSRVTSQATRAARELSLAECRLRLGDLNRALLHLDAAQDAGVEDPLIHLLRGYIRYQQALRDFPRADGGSAARELEFQLACLRAVSAFEQGLGGDLDAQLYWWVSSVLDVAGFTEAAQEALKKAEAAEEALEDDEDEDDGELREEAPSAASSPEAILPQIDPAEERLVDETLRSPGGLEKLLGPDADGRPD